MAYISILNGETIEHIDETLYILMDTDDYFKFILKKNQMKLVYVYMTAINPYINYFEQGDGENVLVCLDEYFTQKLRYNSVEKYKRSYNVDDDTLEIDSDFISSDGGKEIFEENKFFVLNWFKKLIISDTKQVLNSLDLAWAGDMDNLETVIIKGLKKIPERLLNGYTALKNVIIEEGAEELESSVFVACGNLSKNLHIQLPQSLKKLSPNTFVNCRLTEITLPKNITEIPQDCFSWCDIKKITIEGSITCIGNSAFLHNSNLENINLPESLETIGDRAFLGTNIPALKLGKNITYIGWEAFPTSLKDLYIESMNATIHQDAFEANRHVKVHCKENSTMDEYCKIHGISYEYI